MPLSFLYQKKSVVFILKNAKVTPLGSLFQVPVCPEDVPDASPSTTALCLFSPACPFFSSFYVKRLPVSQPLHKQSALRKYPCLCSKLWPLSKPWPQMLTSHESVAPLWISVQPSLTPHYYSPQSIICLSFPACIRAIKVEWWYIWLKSISPLDCKRHKVTSTVAHSRQSVKY